MVEHPAPIPLLALLTDFGSADPYVGSMKAAVYSVLPSAAIVDISHSVEPQNVLEAAFLLYLSYRDFPAGTVFTAVVDPGVGSERRPLLLKAGQYSFCGPDNGIFSYILAQEADWQAFELRNPAYHRPNVSRTFHARDIFAPCAAHHACGVPADQFGPAALEPPLQLPDLFPELSQSELSGRIVRADRFGNLVSNIHIDDIEQLAGAPFGSHSPSVLKVYFGSRELPLRSCYSEGAAGEVFSVWGSSDHLELAMNCESAQRNLEAASQPVRVRLASTDSTSDEER